MSDFTLLAHNTRHVFDLWCPHFAQHFAHHSPAHVWALCWSGNGARRASAETIMTWHDLFQLWLRALSQLETQGGLINVSQSMPLLASSEKEACSDASSLSDYLKFAFAGQGDNSTENAVFSLGHVRSLFGMSF